MAHKKGVGSSRNGRDSNSQRLGVKRSDGQVVRPGTIICASAARACTRDATSASAVTTHSTR